MQIEIPLPENCPHRLRRVIEKHGGKRHRIAKELRVNVYWVQKYIRNWSEPSNPETRACMFFPKSTRKPRRPDYRAAHLNWWRHLDPQTREQWIVTAHELAKNHELAREYANG